MMNKFRNMIKQAFVSLVTDDSERYPRAQGTFNNKAVKFVRLGLYGLLSNPPKDSHVFLFSSQGQESNLFGMINDFLNRKKNLKEGEVVLFNSKTNAYVYLKSDGSIEVISSLSVDVTSPEINAIGIVNITGDLNITGDIAVTGTIDATVDVKAGANDISLIGHTHLGNLAFSTTIPEVSPGSAPVPSTPAVMTAGGDLQTASGITLDTHVHGAVTPGVGVSGVGQ